MQKRIIPASQFDTFSATKLNTDVYEYHTS